MGLVRFSEQSVGNVTSHRKLLREVGYLEPLYALHDILFTR